MLTWNVNTVARACGAGLALVVLSTSLAKAVFGPRTTIGANYQQWSSTVSTNAIDPGFCNGVLSCHVLFQRTPQAQPLIVQHVACRIFVTAGGLIDVLLGTRKEGGGFVNKRTPLVPVPTTGTNWAVNSPVMHLIKTGERPVIFIHNSANANWSVECNVSGKLQQP